MAQTLRDRADEVVAALHALSARPELRELSGISGFSQEGWLVPNAS
ncbi:MAG: hypothetical protein ACR5LF_08270 [Symbiopectobacterium sp.]